MSRAALKRLCEGVATAERTGALFVIVDLRDIRAVLALAREAVRIKSESAAFLKWAREGHGRAALAPLPARTDFERLFSPSERRAMRKGGRR